MKTLWVLLGAVSLALGFVGIFLPLLPTTPFILLAAYCFSKGSDRLYAWLLGLPSVGPMIEQWQRDRSIPARAKALATVMIAASFSYPVFFREGVPAWLRVSLAVFALSVITYLLTRPTREPSPRPERSRS